MYERIKTYISPYSWVYYICAAVFIVLFGRFIFGGTNSDNRRSIEHLERAQDQQHKSLELNKDVTDSVERVKGLNQQASERIVRAQEYQQRASERIDESAKRLDEAERLLERNEQLIERVEQRHQAQSSNGTETKQTEEHLGTD